MPIAELFLSTVVETLLSQLGSGLLAEYARINGISDKLKNWNKKLLMIQSVMDSAEEKQMDDDPAVDRWLAELREIAYDMEDLLDQFSVEAKQNTSKAQSQSGYLPSRLIACCSRIDPRTLLSDHRMADKIEEVDQRLGDVLQDKSLLGLVENSKCRSPFPAKSGQPRFATTSLPEPKFFGREKQKEEMVARLTGIEATDDSIRPFTVVSIVGMGGLGKTTLAQELYNHESMRNAFAIRAWTCVSEVFDMNAITKSVLDEVAQSSPGKEEDLNRHQNSLRKQSMPIEKEDLNRLQNSLREQLSGKKFLIVLDDVWNENYDELQSLIKPLYSGSRGSRILLTTRNKEVAKLFGDRDPGELDLLSWEECLSLLAYHSIGKDNFGRDPHLHDIAVQLAYKCKGLPLAAKTIGGLLRFENNDEKWKEVLAHGIWDRERGHGKIPTALKLSYVHLPIHLKRCFAACALFPKDYSFDGDELIQLWTAQGLLHKGTAKTYRYVGMDYLHQLEARSLLQKTRDEKTQYSMHDLINDLAKSVVGGTYFSSDKCKAPSREESQAKVRHAAMVAQFGERCLPRIFDVYRSMKKLRTFMLFPTSRESYPNIYVSKKVIYDLIMDMKHLRMLSLRYFIINTVPDQIGELKLLRSIDFSHTDIEVLPESICDLVELQSLLLRGCKHLKKLPRNIRKLTNLLHLDIVGANSLGEMPPGIGDLTNLEILSSFVVGKEAGQELTQLGPLKCLQGGLHIHNLLDVDDVGDARIANLHEKEGVLELSYNWGSIVEISRDDEHQFKLLDHLQPPGKIEALDIHHYGGKRFPSWFGKSCLNNVVGITLKGCKSVEALPPFGRLPSLERLFISDLDAVSTIGEEFYGSKTPFRSLRRLTFENMQAWKMWSFHGSCENDQPFPCLNELTMNKCPKLNRGLPGRLDSLFKLDIKKCPLLAASGDTLSLPSLSEMYCNDGLLKCLVDGKEQVPPKLKNLVVRDCEDIEKLPDDLYCLTSLNEMTVVNCGKLSSFTSAGLPAALRILEVVDCPSLPQSQLISTRLLESLEMLVLENLEGLMSITDLVVGTRLSQSLQGLSIGGCGNLTTLSDSLHHLSSLSDLCVWGCDALELDCFPALPCNLSWFELDGCPKVRSLPNDMHNLTSLKELRILGCEGIRCLQRGGGLPPNLETLYISGCRNLDQPLEKWGLRELNALRHLHIKGEMVCMDEMACFPPSSSAGDSDAWRRLLPSCLVILEISDMVKLERLAYGLSAHLTSLQDLYIWGNRRMRWLPGDGLPDSLESLCIDGCPLLKERCSEPNGDYLPLIQLIPCFSKDQL